MNYFTPERLIRLQDRSDEQQFLAALDDWERVLERYRQQLNSIEQRLRGIRPRIPGFLIYLTKRSLHERAHPRHVLRRPRPLPHYPASGVPTGTFGDPDLFSDPTASDQTSRPARTIPFGAGRLVVRRINSRKSDRQREGGVSSRHPAQRWQRSSAPLPCCGP